jgi:threonyl-tRNA synthetase
VLELYPHAKPTLGPSIDTGFYYDFDFGTGEKPTSKELGKIEQKMRELLKKWDVVSGETVTVEQALQLFEKNPYKVELIKEIAERNEPVSLYHSGSSEKPLTSDTALFTDLCGGGHCASPSKEMRQAGFKLDRIAGAYWRGDENNIMLTRIYGLAFESKEALKVYEENFEEAKKRDHRILGKQLGLYSIDQTVGSGLPLWKPAGALILLALRRWFEDEQLKRNYLPVLTPHIGRKVLWETSGHWGFYNNSMYPPLEVGQTLEDFQDKRTPKESEIYCLKPMNCPFHMSIYKDDLHSYRELPLRYYEFGTVYRYEQKGELGGLTRVRGFTQDDAHIICSREQLKEEMKNVLDFAFYVLKDTFGFEIDIHASFRDKNSAKYLGKAEDWDIAEKTIIEVLNEKGIPYIEEAGEAAFYGPKMDFKVKDSIGRKWQLSTIQFDFNLPERFDLTYKNSKGEDERPFIIHRALLGSLERFMGIIIEHYAGAFPLWLAPRQVCILPIADAHNTYADEVFTAFKNAGLRTEIHNDSETLGKKIRRAKMAKIPYILIIGDKEVENNEITIESRDRGNEGSSSVVNLIKKLTDEIRKKTN